MQETYILLQKALQYQICFTVLEGCEIRKTNIVGARFPPEDVELLRKVCVARGEDISSFIRRAVKTELARLSFYPSEVKKALGIDVLKV